MATTENCQCCTGAVEMDFLPCDGCLEAITRQDRDGHPHELSPAQQALRDEDVVGGRIELVFERRAAGDEI